MIVPGELAGTMTDDDYTEMLAARGDDGARDLNLALAPGPHACHVAGLACGGQAVAKNRVNPGH